MKPESNSLKMCSITKAFAKMIEFDVPEADRHINVRGDVEDLFTLVIGMLGDISDAIIAHADDLESILDAEAGIRFCASFFDAYKNTHRLSLLDDYNLLVGSAAYYICDLPGSAAVLINEIGDKELDLACSHLDDLLRYLLRGQYSNVKTTSGAPYGNSILAIKKAVSDYFATGDNEGVIFDACRELRALTYNEGSPRELFFADLIYAICVKKVNNSCWRNLPTFTGISKEIWAPIITKGSFITELWPAQMLLGKEGVFSGHTAVVQMPTSAGKTKSIEIIIRSAFLSYRASVAVMVAPYRALCHEIKDDFYRAFNGEVDVGIDEINDALETKGIEAFYGDEKKHIIILTPEKLYYLLVMRQGIAQNIGLVIFDEGHQFDNGGRGVTYELLLTQLNCLLLATCQKVLISAVISNAQQVSQWLSKDGGVVQGNNALPTERFVGCVNFDQSNGKISFVHKYWGNYEEDFFLPRVIHVEKLPQRGREVKDRYFPDIQEPKSIALYLALKMSQKVGVAIFCARKDSVGHIIEAANDYFMRLPDSPHPKGDGAEIKKLCYLIAANIGSETYICAAAKNGIFAHHANIPYGIKMAVEYAMHEARIYFIVCTSTLAEG